MAEFGSIEKKSTGDKIVGASVRIAPGLYIVATPIGNLGDITERAVKTLSSVDLVACEDTRVSSKLMRAFLIKTPLVAYHDYSDEKARDRLLTTVSEGGSVALISDAGTPLISDPGYKLVEEARALGIAVFSIPGPSALIAALSVAGLPTDRFLFMGFSPNKSGARRNWFEAEASTNATLCFYESPRRLRESLKDAHNIFGDRDAAICRELTKKFETVKRGQLGELYEYYEANGDPKGEIVVIIAPGKKLGGTTYELDSLDILKNALNHMSVKSAASFVAELTGAKKRDLYAKALEIADARDG